MNFFFLSTMHGSCLFPLNSILFDHPQSPVVSSQHISWRSLLGDAVFPHRKYFVVLYVLLPALSFYSKWLLSHSRIERAEIIFLRRHRAFRLIDYKRKVNIMKELTFRKGEEIKIGKEEPTGYKHRES